MCKQCQGEGADTEPQPPERQQHPCGVGGPSEHRASCIEDDAKRNQLKRESGAKYIGWRRRRSHYGRRRHPRGLAGSEPLLLTEPASHELATSAPFSTCGAPAQSPPTLHLFFKHCFAPPVSMESHPAFGGRAKRDGHEHHPLPRHQPPVPAHPTMAGRQLAARGDTLQQTGIERCIFVKHVHRPTFHMLPQIFYRLPPLTSRRQISTVFLSMLRFVQQWTQ